MASAATGEFQALRVYARISSYRLDFLTALIALGQIELHEVRFPLLWLSLPVTIALQRQTVKADLRSAAEDSSTRPMSQEAWLIAAGEIVAALPVVAVMRVNTAAPLAVAEVAQMQAGCDAIGYAGDSGLAILLVDCPDINADALATRLRTALRRQSVEASVATAAKGRDGYSLDDLLAVCEAELIARDAANRSARPSRPDPEAGCRYASRSARVSGRSRRAGCRRSASRLLDELHRAASSSWAATVARMNASSAIRWAWLSRLASFVGTHGVSSPTAAPTMARSLGQRHRRQAGCEGLQHRLARTLRMAPGQVSIDRRSIDLSLERLDDLGLRPAARDVGIEVVRQLGHGVRTPSS